MLTMNAASFLEEDLKNKNMRKIIFKSENNNHYLLSESNGMILYLPNKSHRIQPNKVNSSYYTRKEEFWEKHGVFKSYVPNLDVNYDDQRIKSNLANLRMLLIEMTDGCNLACKYCGYRDMYNNYDKREDKKQNFINVKALIDYLEVLWRSPLNVSYNNIITIGFYGGEPLLSFEMIKQTIEYLDSLKLKEIKFSFNMTTNAMLLDLHMDYLVDKNFNILISLDGNENNNSYRVTKNGKPSFSKIVSNTLLLKEKYPQYFKDHVQFNSVLHNNNSVEDIYYFIKQKFDKIPTIAELNSNGVIESKKEEFYRMFRNRIQDADRIEGCEDLKEDLYLSDPNVANLDYFIDAFLSNTFKSYADLFIDEKKQKYIPTGTCQPFNRKIFLTVNGKILPCERIGQNLPIGKVENGKVNIDYVYIRDFYAGMYQKLIDQCKDCALWKNCTLCVYLIEKKENNKKCSRFISKNNSCSYFSYYISFIENKPTLYKRVVNEISKY